VEEVLVELGDAVASLLETARKEAV